MNLEIFGLVFEFLGTLLIAITVLRVHVKIHKEKRIDRNVLTQIKKEYLMTTLGIMLLILGFALEIINILKPA